MRLSLYLSKRTAFSLLEINMLNATTIQLQEISKELGLSLNLQEMKAIQAYFKKNGRKPTDVELQTIAQTWSEHCFHKTFKGRIRINKMEISSLFRTYIAKATEELKPKWCFSVFEDNAGIITFDKGYGIAAKVETHNHPSAVEPFGGAATGVGGVIRDILGVWADPIACTDVLGFGPLDYDYTKLPTGVKHPKYVYKGVTAGIASYGNNMGIPTVNGAIYFDDSYTGNVVVYCGCIGLLPLKKFKNKGKPEHLILVVGGKTGRDGIHGVTFASAELTEKSEEVSRPAVQIANPIEEEKLKRAIIEIRDRELASAITDLGGGGMSSAIGETAERFGCGAVVDLDKVPLKYDGLAPWEIYISESQERMLLVIPPENKGKVMDVFEREDVEATAVGKLTRERRLLLRFEKVVVADMDMPFLFSPPKSLKTAKHKKADLEEAQFPEPKNLTETLLKLMAAPNIASKESVVRTYDHEVKGNTVLKPFQGEHAGPNDAAIIKPLNNSWKGIALSCGMNPDFGKIDAYWMAAAVIDEAVRNNVAVGGHRIALLDNFVWGNPEKPERLSSLVQACRACYDIATGFGTPFISGKDSLYNESPLGTVTPTLLITAVGIVPDIRLAVSIDHKAAGNLLYIVGKTYIELGGSEYYKLKGFLGKTVPKLRVAQARRIYNALTKAIGARTVRACHDLSEGGLAVAAAEMTLASGYGAELELRKIPSEMLKRNDFALFSESNSRFLVEIEKKDRENFERLMKGKEFAMIGKVTKTPFLKVRGLKGAVAVDASVADLRASWKGTLSGEA